MPCWLATRKTQQWTDGGPGTVALACYVAGWDSFSCGGAGSTAAPTCFERASSRSLRRCAGDGSVDSDEASSEFVTCVREMCCGCVACACAMCYIASEGSGRPPYERRAHDRARRRRGRGRPRRAGAAAAWHATAERDAAATAACARAHEANEAERHHHHHHHHHSSLIIITPPPPLGLISAVSS